ncbi:hypothetical protein HYC85_022094 [Camellia sinensis]|uniref:ELM2 domain-containing protein n=1 Tax=Camellia sinensis TaxID=4442 RepID=A0A7J7GKA1_CAMSI|nr:hypothetical protein HYC85_022094 [Camellia sinensis]
MKVTASHIEMDSDRRKKNDKASLPNVGGVGQTKSAFGKYSDSDMLSWIKRLALDPCTSGPSQSTIRPLWNQTMKVRKVMALSVTEFPRRKRKLQQFLKDKFAYARGLTSETSNQQSVTNLSKGQLSRASSNSCLLNSIDSTGSFNKKIFLNSSSSGSLLTCEDNVVDWGPPNHDICPSIESDESISGSILVSPKRLNLDNPKNSLDLDDSVHSSSSPSSGEPKQVYLQAPRRSIRLLNFIGDHLQRMIVPVGPRFQADVPEWTGPPKKENLNGQDADSENSRWLGTQIWPLKGRTTETTKQAVGEGRSSSCTCVSPGSIDCTKRHVLEERLILRSDLGPAFLSWKFDEMGEEVSKSWTLKEQERYESLVKMYPLSNRKNFLKHALKSFPSKGKESILRYYFNVFIPRRMSLQTRPSLTQGQ